MTNINWIEFTPEIFILGQVGLTDITSIPEFNQLVVYEMLVGKDADYGSKLSRELCHDGLISDVCSEHRTGDQRLYTT